MALTLDERRAHYLAQTGKAELTPAQSRRVRKAEHRALSPHAAVARPSRLRKAWERKRRRELRADAVVLMHAVRNGYVGEMRRGTLASRLLRTFRRKGR